MKRYAILLLALAGVAMAAPAEPPKPTLTDRTLMVANTMPTIVYGFVTPETVIIDGFLFPMEEGGVVLGPGDRIAPGVYWGFLGLETESDCGRIDWEDQTLVVGSGWEVNATEGGISTTCGAGWYACCYCTGNNCPVARCRQNGTAEPPGGCQGGGPGSTSCSISRSQCP